MLTLFSLIIPSSQSTNTTYYVGISAAASLGRVSLAFRKPTDGVETAGYIAPKNGDVYTAVQHTF